MEALRRALLPLESSFFAPRDAFDAQEGTIDTRTLPRFVLERVLPGACTHISRPK